MFGRRITLFRLLGFEIRIDTSWILIAALITWSLAQGVFPFYYKGLSPFTYWWMGAVGALGLFGSIIFHELCHSLVARQFGLQMKGITLFVFGGVAEMEEEPRSPLAEFLMAIAGPLASILLAILFYIFYGIGRISQWPHPPVLIINYLSTINLVLAIFNMLPAFPLDGGRVFRSILWRWKGNLKWATRIASQVGSTFGLLLIFAGVFSVITGGVISGIWWALIGLFLRSASRNSYQGVLVRSALEGEPVRKFMRPDPVTVAPDTTIDHLVEDYIYKYHYKMFPVTTDHRPLAVVSLSDIKTIPREEWTRHTVSELAKPRSEENSIEENMEAVKALSIMNRTGNSSLMVIDSDGRITGMIALRDLIRFLSVKLNLEEDKLQKMENPD